MVLARQKLERENWVEGKRRLQKGGAAGGGPEGGQKRIICRSIEQEHRRIFPSGRVSFESSYG